jgi:hypothetical protein
VKDFGTRKIPSPDAALGDGLARSASQPTIIIFHTRFCPCAGEWFCKASLMAGAMTNKVRQIAPQLFSVHNCDRLSPNRISPHRLGSIQF